MDVSARRETNGSCLNCQFPSEIFSSVCFNSHLCHPWDRGGRRVGPRTAEHSRRFRRILSRTFSINGKSFRRLTKTWPTCFVSIILGCRGNRSAIAADAHPTRVRKTRAFFSPPPAVRIRFWRRFQTASFFFSFCLTFCDSYIFPSSTAANKSQLVWVNCYWVSSWE